MEKLKLFIGFLLTLIFLSGCVIEQPVNAPLETPNQEELSAEEVLNMYISNIGFNGISDRLEKAKLKKPLARGIVLKSLENTETFATQIISMDSDWEDLCNQMKVVLKQNDCGSVGRASSIFKNWVETNEILSQTVVEENEEIMKVKIRYKNTRKLNFEENEILVEDIVILTKKEDGWKVSDFVNESGKLFSETNELEKTKANFDNMLEILREGYLTQKATIDKYQKEQQQINLFEKQLSDAITNVMPAERVINAQIDSYNNQTDKYVISITYYFKDEFLADDYLRVMKDSSNFFESVFPISLKIYQVQTTVVEKYNDDYGNQGEKYLARTSMNRRTYNKINWDNFESNKLRNIANVIFFGDSIYKSLKDIEDVSQKWQNVYTEGFLGIGGLSPSLCNDAKEDCAIDGDCDTYKLLNSQGIC